MVDVTDSTGLVSSPGAALPAPAPAALPATTPWFTCVSCEDVFPATSFRREPDGRIAPKLKGALMLKTPNTCICKACIVAHHEMLRRGDLGV